MAKVQEAGKMKKWAPKDVIALIVIGGGIFLLASGINHYVGMAHIAVICAYYGIDLAPFFKIGRNQGRKKEDKISGVS